MSREVRMVKPGWEHPKDRQTGNFLPLFGNTFERDLAAWEEEKLKFENRDDLRGKYTFEEWWGERPDLCDYMPQWEKSEATLYCMYETTSEGAPISPPFKTPEELASWLFLNKASAFGGQTATYEAWLNMIHVGWAPSGAVIDERGLISGVEAIVGLNDEI